MHQSAGSPAHGCRDRVAPRPAGARAQRLPRGRRRRTAAKVEAFLSRALEATGSEALTTAGALVPWICDVLLSNHSVKAYGRDLMDFLRQMRAQGVTPLDVTPDHVKLYKRRLLEAG